MSDETAAPVTSLGQLSQKLRLLIFERTDPYELVEPYRNLLVCDAWKALAVTDRATHVDMKLLHEKWRTKIPFYISSVRGNGKSLRAARLKHLFPQDWFPLNLEDAGGNGRVIICDEMINELCDSSASDRLEYWKWVAKQRPQSTVAPALTNEVMHKLPPLEMEEVD